LNYLNNKKFLNILGEYDKILQVATSNEDTKVLRKL